MCLFINNYFLISRVLQLGNVIVHNKKTYCTKSLVLKKLLCRLISPQTLNVSSNILKNCQHGRKRFSKS